MFIFISVDFQEHGYYPVFTFIPMKSMDSGIYPWKKLFTARHSLTIKFSIWARRRTKLASPWYLTTGCCLMGISKPADLVAIMALPPIKREWNGTAISYLSK